MSDHPSDPLSSVIAALKRENLIPEVIPEDFQPSVLFDVIFPGGTQVILSGEVRREDTLQEPDIRITPMHIPEIDTTPLSSEHDVKYTLVMVDPDAPSRAEPKYKQWRHWVIPGLQISSEGDASKGNLIALKTRPAITPYWPPGPPPASGLHRYTFILFQEPPGMLIVPEGEPEYGATLEERRSWNVTKFSEKYNLKLVGANFFLCRNSAQP